MKNKISILYAWFVRTITYFLPDIPVFMRLRGFFYGLLMEYRGVNFQVTHNAVLNSLYKISVGDNVYIAYNCCLIANGHIKLGNNVLFGPNVVISSGNHIYNSDGLQKKSNQCDVFISDDCWIAANTTIVGGASIPARSILAAGAVLTKNYSNSESGIYAGVPAKMIKKICYQ